METVSEKRRPPVDNSTRVCRSHCSACGSHFTSDAAFDAHRGGSYRDNTRHCWPEGSEERLLVHRDDGRCEIGAAEPLHGVTLWRRNPDFRSAGRPSTAGDAEAGV